MKISYKGISTAALILGFASLIIFSLLFWIKSLPFDFSPPLDTDRLDHFGSLIGGLVGALFSLASILLLIHTIQEQALNDKRQKIETRFFELLKIHRENCQEISLSGRLGRTAFPRLARELRLCIKLVTDLNTKLGKGYPDDKIINVAYLLFYFGCRGGTSQSKLNILKNHLLDIDEDFVESLIKVALKTAEEEHTKEELHDDKFLLGNQIRFSHYFRHLFQTVNYINVQTVISFEDKYEYIKTLRAQLSPQEQLIFFCNSLSVMGYEWEKNHPDNANKQLITKYNLIKHISNTDIAIKYYPNVEFEGLPLRPEKKDLKKLYK